MQSWVTRKSECLQADRAIFLGICWLLSTSVENLVDKSTRVDSLSPSVGSLLTDVNSLSTNVDLLSTNIDSLSTDVD